MRGVTLITLRGPPAHGNNVDVEAWRKFLVAAVKQPEKEAFFAMRSIVLRTLADPCTDGIAVADR
jgi:hypothetical protein